MSDKLTDYQNAAELMDAIAAVLRTFRTAQLITVPPAPAESNRTNGSSAPASASDPPEVLHIYLE
jgi:hypothetical protein